MSLPDLLEQKEWAILGLVVLSFLGVYCVRLVTTFRGGIFSKCWKEVTAGAVILALAQIPIIVSEVGPLDLQTLLADAGALMRLAGVTLIIIGLRSQSRVWRMEGKDEEIKINPQENLA